MQKLGNYIINNGKLIQFLGGTRNAVIPDGVTIIGAGAFHGYDVESVYIPDGVIEIGNNCFNDCKNLKEIRIPTSVQKISDTAFRDTCGVQIVAQKGSVAWIYAQQNGAVNVKDTSISTAASAKTMRNDRASALSQKTAVSSSGTSEASPAVKTPQTSATRNSNTAEASFSTSSPKTIADDKTSSVAKNSLDLLLEKELQSTYSSQAKEQYYTRILGCKVGDRPWTMRNNFLGRATRFASRIKHITDQELLITIAHEASLLEIKCAAIRNITVQEELIRYAKHSYSDVRLAALCNLTDQVTIGHLATADENSTIRDVAIKKVKDDKIVKGYLMKVDKVVSQSEVNKISNIKDLQELAMLAQHYSVRKHAANLLPTNTAESRLLKGAAEISEKIEPYAIERFKISVEQLSKTDSEILKLMILKYPFEGVRYLARQKGNITPKSTNNMEDLLRSKTPSQREMKQRAQINKCERLLSEARRATNQFVDGCHSTSNQGRTSYETQIDRWSNSAETFDDAKMFVEILLKELHLKGFTRISVDKNAECSTKIERYGNEWREVQGDLLGFSFKIYTHW